MHKLLWLPRLCTSFLISKGLILSEPKTIKKKKRKIGRGATDKNVKINTAVLILRGCIKIELQN